MTEFEHTIECQVGRDFAWKFWTNLDNWAAVDPGLNGQSWKAPSLREQLAGYNREALIPTSGNWLKSKMEEGPLVDGHSTSLYVTLRHSTSLYVTLRHSTS